MKHKRKTRKKRESSRGDLSWPKRRHRQRRKNNSKEDRDKIHPDQGKIQPVQTPY